MDNETLQSLAGLINTQRVAALGTIHEGSPLVSMVAYQSAPDFSAFYIHISRLAQHTQGILQDSRVSLMIAEADTGKKEPQTLARISMQGEAIEIPQSASGYEDAKTLYLSKFPGAAISFGLGDFSIYSIQPRRARHIGGFGRIFDLTPEDFRRAAEIGF